MGNVVKKILVVAALFLGVAYTQAQAQSENLDRTPIEATTATGEKVRLYPTGKWEFVDVAKAAEAKKVADAFPENKVRHVDAQGGWFPGTKTLMPGDKDYNRKSMSGK